MLCLVRNKDKRLMRNTILGQSHLKLGDTYYYPLESTVHISHIARHAVAGERHAFSLEEDRRQKTEDRMRGAELARKPHAETAETAETPVISSGPRPEGEGSRELSSCQCRHFERSGAESRNPFMQKHREERKNLTQITQIFTEIPVRRRIMLASERITRNREAELSRRNSGNSRNPRHFERSGAESRNPFTQKHREER